jgi:hypothetical protein
MLVVFEWSRRAWAKCFVELQGAESGEQKHGGNRRKKYENIKKPAIISSSQ